MKSTRITAAALLLLGSGLMLQAAQAQTAGVHRADLVQHDLSVPDREGIQVRVDFDPGAFAPKHSHPGEELAHVLQGTLEYQLGDNPPVTLTAGNSLFIPAGTAHSARNVGSGKASELATYIVKKGAPLVVPAK
ncbi:cupin domain-containing protein [Cupriavidus sp. WKF15]|uniref:cupin domain-containing protein n=1 Tax=Cupriavidus sp. WKF15 TaxID=3032282 RepID=UPI0023E2FABF|nr:cupin domain-containing protein [Cupriavidus sp. WKF15]WER50823.1 cupin domain-containing protein [Cupriavidus sp. WKF15]